MLQFVDAWTNNFAYVGHRATGTAAGDYLLVPSGWSGEAGAATVIHVPTRVASIVGRWACAGADDLPAVHALQDAAELQPLDADATASGLPAIDPDVPEDLVFFEKLRVWSQALPPAARDLPVQESLADTGITQTADSPYANPDAEFATWLREGRQDGETTLEQVLASGGSSPIVNGWKLTMHVFDYNLDFFEVGALDDPVQARGPEGPLRRADGRRVSRSVGQPRLRGGVHHDLRRRPGRPLNGSRSCWAARRLRVRLTDALRRPHVPAPDQASPPSAVSPKTSVG